MAAQVTQREAPGPKARLMELLGVPPHGDSISADLDAASTRHGSTRNGPKRSDASPSPRGSHPSRAPAETAHLDVGRLHVAPIWVDDAAGVNVLRRRLQALLEAAVGEGSSGSSESLAEPEAAAAPAPPVRIGIDTELAHSAVTWPLRGRYVRIGIDTEWAHASETKPYSGDDCARVALVQLAVDGAVWLIDACGPCAAALAELLLWALPHPALLVL